MTAHQAPGPEGEGSVAEPGRPDEPVPAQRDGGVEAGTATPTGDTTPTGDATGDATPADGAAPTDTDTPADTTKAEDAATADDAAPVPPPTLADGLLFAFGTLTVVPVTVPRWDRATAGVGMAWAPVVGLTVGLCSAALAGVLLVAGSGALLAAVASVAAGAVLTRGLHLDGLADTADGLGSGGPAEDALRIMKQSDIGPFGVLTLVLVLLGQVAALAGLYGRSWAEGAVAAAVAATAARLALTLAARPGVPPARPGGLGAVVAGTVPAQRGLVTAAVTVAAAAAVGTLFGTAGIVRCALAVLLACGAAQLLRQHCVRRLGGVTGDVFGALAETAATVALVVLTFTV